LGGLADNPSRATGFWEDESGDFGGAEQAPAVVGAAHYRDERAVLLITGTGLKDVPAAMRRASIPKPVLPDLDAVERLLEESGH